MVTPDKKEKSEIIYPLPPVRCTLYCMLYRGNDSQSVVTDSPFALPSIVYLIAVKIDPRRNKRERERGEIITSVDIYASLGWVYAYRSRNQYRRLGVCHMLPHSAGISLNASCGMPCKYLCSILS